VLSDESAWRIWPGDVPETLRWLSTTELDLEMIEHEICTHALVDRAGGSQVRVISAAAEWPAHAVRRSLADG
jgi:hypothetical protein